MDIEYMKIPAEVPFPSWVINSGVFAGGEGEPHKHGRAFRWKEGGLDHAIVVIGGSALTQKHLEAWRKLYVQRRLCEACYGSSGLVFEIVEPDLMKLLGVEASDHLGRAEMLKVVGGLGLMSLESTLPPTKSGRKWDRWRSESLFSMYGHRDSISEPWLWSFTVGPSFDGSGLPFDSVRVTNIDIQELSYWVPVPLRGRDSEVDSHDDEMVVANKVKRRRPPRTPGFVYILTNPAMPGLIKIGKTRLNPADRAAQLHTTGVPAGFQVQYACRTPDPEAVEQAMHVAFGPTRLSHKREFFQLSVEQAIAVLSLHHQDGVPAAVDS